MPPIAPLSPAFLTLAAATSWLPTLSRRRAGIGLVLFGLAAASLNVGGSPGPSAARDINSALLVLGVASVVVVGLRDRRRGIPPVILALSSLVLVRAAFTDVSPGRAGLSALIIGVAVVLLWGAIFYSAPGRLIRWLEARIGWAETDVPFTITRADWPLGVLFGLGYLAVGLGNHVALVVFGVVASAVAVFGVGRRNRCGPGAWWLLVTATSALATLWFLSVVAGPVGLRLSALGEVPLSPAAELAVGIPLMVAVWSLLGLFPFHARVPSGLLALAGAALFIRVGAPALPLGLEHWQPVAFPIAVLATWHAAATRRLDEALAAAVLAGLASLTPTGETGALWLAGVALAIQVGRWLEVQPLTSDLMDRAFWLVGAWGGYLALLAGLQTEVVYSVLMLGGVASLLMTGAARR